MKKFLVAFPMLIFFSADSLNPINIPPEELKPLTVIELIEKYSDEYDVPYKLAYELARAESKFNPTAKNPKSSAKGIYQFINSTWKGSCDGNVLEAEHNIKCAMELIGSGKIQHWTADQYIRLKLWDLGFLKCKNYDKNWCKLVWD